MKGNALYYTIYHAADDSIVAFGSAGDCARMLNMTLPSFYSMISCINHGKSKRYEYYSEPLENPEYDLDPYVLLDAAETARCGT